MRSDFDSCQTNNRFDRRIKEVTSVERIRARLERIYSKQKEMQALMELDESYSVSVINNDESASERHPEETVRIGTKGARLKATLISKNVGIMTNLDGELRIDLGPSEIRFARHEKDRHMV